MKRLSLILVLFSSFIFMFTSACIKQASYTSVSEGGNNYLLMNFGFNFRKPDPDGKTDSVFLRSSYANAVKYFFANDEYGLFKMDYNVTPALNVPPFAQEKPDIIDSIKLVASKLKADSDFFYFYNGHGDPEGFWIDVKSNPIYPEDVINALKKGLDENPNTKSFRRFVIMAFSCHSGAFTTKFVAKYKELIAAGKISSLFKEHYAIISSDAEKVSYGGPNTGNWDIFVPVLLLLRAQQFTPDTDINTTYEKVQSFLNRKDIKFVTDVFKNLLEDYKVTVKDLITTRFTSVNEREKTVEKEDRSFNERNPTIKDIKIIMENLRKLTPKPVDDPSHFTMDIHWDEFSSTNLSIFN